MASRSDWPGSTAFSISGRRRSRSSPAANSSPAERGAVGGRHDRRLEGGDRVDECAVAPRVGVGVPRRDQPVQLEEGLLPHRAGDVGRVDDGSRAPTTRRRRPPSTRRCSCRAGRGSSGRRRSAGAWRRGSGRRRRRTRRRRTQRMRSIGSRRSPARRSTENQVVTRVASGLSSSTLARLPTWSWSSWER